MVLNDRENITYNKNNADTNDRTLSIERELWAQKVEKEFICHADLNAPREIADKVFNLPKKRLISHTNRSFFVKKTAEYILRQQGRIQEWDMYEPQIVKLALCAEMMIAVQYYHNYIFDSKAGVNTRLLVRETLVKSNLLKSWLFHYIDNNFDTELTSVISKNVDKVFNLTDIGQYIEGHYNSYDYYCSPIKTNITDYFSFEDNSIDWAVINDCVSMVTSISHFSNQEGEFIKLYFLRLFLISTTLYNTWAKILCDLFNSGAKINHKVSKFSSYYGIMMQVVNDNADFVPGYMDQDTKAKSSQDQQSDIRNKNITLPLILHLHFHPKRNVIWDHLNSKKSAVNREKFVFEEIVPVLKNYSIPIGEKISKFSIGCIDQDFGLIQINDIAKGNRFYKIIFSLNDNF